MSGLERLRLTGKRSEASSLLPVHSPALLDGIGASAGWWICHDEGDVDAMVSMVVEHDGEWALHQVELAPTDTGRRTDAEALARLDDQVFVFGSSFADKRGGFDDRRAFVARFSEAAVLGGAAPIDVLDLGPLWRRVLDETGGVELLPGGDHDLVNVEGACFVDDALVLGLRWPVSADGQPLLLQLAGAGPVLASPEWSVDALGALSASVHVVDIDASSKRPAGVRGMTTFDDEVHLVTGQTERDLAAKKVKAAPALHVRVTGSVSGSRLAANVVERFEGFRKVEGLAAMPDGGWLYALDDEDAVVVVVSVS